MFKKNFSPHKQVYAWGDNDHGQQGNGTTTVNRKPTLVQGLEGQKITRVACGSSHSVAWTTVDVATPSVHEPVLFQTARDPLGASYLGKSCFFSETPVVMAVLGIGWKVLLLLHLLQCCRSLRGTVEPCCMHSITLYFSLSVM